MAEAVSFFVSVNISQGLRPPAGPNGKIEEQRCAKDSGKR